MRAIPPEWPTGVPPPDADGWAERATSWLFDQGPPELRGYPVLRRHPLVLAYLVELFVGAANKSVAEGLSRVRGSLREWGLQPEAVEEAVAVHEHELRRLALQESAVRAIGAALRGERWVPRL